MAALLLFSACSLGSPQVGKTVVDSTLFPGSQVSDVAALPFTVDLPNGWTIREEAFLYTLAFDEGASGYIQVMKEPRAGEWEDLTAGYSSVDSGVEMKCQAMASTYCYARVDDSVWALVLVDKSMTAERHAEALAILASARAR